MFCSCGVSLSQSLWHEWICSYHEDFCRAWTHFELIAAAKEWNAAKQLTISPTLLRGKLIDFYTEFDEDTKGSLELLKKALLEKAGLQEDPLVVSKTFNQHDQLPSEKVGEYASMLKQLFKQAYPTEAGAESTVLLQRFLMGLRPSITRQMLLQKKPTTLAQAITDAIAVEYALQFSQAESEHSTPDSVNVLRSSGTGKQSSQQDGDVAKLHKTVEALSKQVEALQATCKQHNVHLCGRNVNFSHKISKDIAEIDLLNPVIIVDRKDIYTTNAL